MFKATCVAFALLFSLTAIGLYLYVGLHGFSARDKPAQLEQWLAKRARRLAIPPNIRNLKNPVSPTPLNLAQARDVVDAWRLDYNQARPHSSLGYLTPDEFATQVRSSIMATPFARAGSKL